jgi:hypothetical protein
VKALSKVPFFGVGGGEIGSPRFHEGNASYLSLHLFFFEPLFDLGVVGFLFFLFAQSAVVYGLLLKTKDDSCGHLAKAGILSLVCFWISSIGMSSGIYFLSYYLLLGYLGALGNGRLTWRSK